MMRIPTVRVSVFIVLFLSVSSIAHLWMTYNTLFEPQEQRPQHAGGASQQSPRRVAVVTIITSDAYLIGARATVRSMRLIHPSNVTSTCWDMVVLVGDAVSESALQSLRQEACGVIRVRDIVNPYMNGSRFIGVFNKLHLWSMVQFDLIIYIDADCIVLEDLTPLLACERFCMRENRPPKPLTCQFNSGVMVLVPSMNKYRTMLHVLESKLLPSEDLTDQGFLNSFHFFDCLGLVSNPDSEDDPSHIAHELQHARQLQWEQSCDHIPWLSDGTSHRCQKLDYAYNFDVSSCASWWHSWLTRHIFSIFIVHFTGTMKPWHCTNDTDTTLWQRLTCSQWVYDKFRQLSAG